jgi:hypothetical protein
MMTDLATIQVAETDGAPRRALPTLATGLTGGFVLGIVARAWMRLITDRPEFSWNGTLFIIFGFTVFGLAQSIVAVARRRTTRRRALVAVRIAGGVGMLPLFVAAGAVMFPTVLGAGLAFARVEWSRVSRGICLVVAAGPVIFVGSDLIDKFGWSLHMVAGFVVMLAVYGTIIRATRFTLARQADGWRLPRWAVVAIVVLLAIAFLVPLAGGGIK